MANITPKEDINVSLSFKNKKEVKTVIIGIKYINKLALIAPKTFTV